MIRTRLNGLEDEESSWRKMENCSLIDFPYEESRKRHNTNSGHLVSAREAARIAMARQ